MAQKVGEILKQSVVIDNRGGAGGVIGMEMSVRATPDGYTLGMVSGSIATTAAAYKLPYDPVKDIAPISMVGEAGYLITLNPSVPVKTTVELIAYAKANPGKITYGSSGVGSTSHLAGELFDLMAGTQMTHVPYKSSGPALTDMLGGQIQMIYGSSPLVAPHVNSGRLRLIAITTLKRSRALPNIPTVAESGVPGYEASGWFGVIAPAAAPREVVARLSAALMKGIMEADARERLAALGGEVVPNTPAEFATRIRDDLAKWRKLIAVIGLKAGEAG